MEVQSPCLASRMNRMKNTFYHSIIYLLSVFFLMVAGVSCVDPIAPLNPEDPDDLPMTLQLSIPISDLVTKSDPTPADDDDEKQLHDLQVWAFIHAEEGEGGRDMPVAYVPQQEGSINGKITLSFDKSVIGLLGDPAVFVDIYVLGNASSIGFSVGAKATRAEVRDFLLQGSAATGFGTACVSEVPNTENCKGLPMSCHLDNLDITFLRYGFTSSQLKAIEDGTVYSYLRDFNAALGNITGLTDLQKEYLREFFKVAENQYVWDYAKFSPVMTLTRAVSKIRFFFVKGTDVPAEESIDITSIDFVSRNVGVIPEKTYLFPRQGIVKSGTEYDNIVWTGANNVFLRSGEIRKVENPETQVKRTTETVAEYEARMKQIATTKVIYLRESDKSVKGRIRYTRTKGDVTRTLSLTFDFVGLADAFPRNSAWSVYVYFTENSVNAQFQLVVSDWDYNKATVGFEAGSIAAAQPNGRFSLDEDTFDNMVFSASPNDHFLVYPREESGSLAPVKGFVQLKTPQNGKLYVVPHYVSTDAEGAFSISPTEESPVLIDGPITITITPAYDNEHNLKGKSGDAVYLSFWVVTADGRLANADSELINDVYWFVLP